MEYLLNTFHRPAAESLQVLSEGDLFPAVINRKERGREIGPPRPGHTTTNGQGQPFSLGSQPVLPLLHAQPPGILMGHSFWQPYQKKKKKKTISSILQEAYQWGRVNKKGIIWCLGRFHLLDLLCKPRCWGGGHTPTYLFPSCDNMLQTKQLENDLGAVCVNSTRRRRDALSAWDRAIAPSKVFILIFMRTHSIVCKKLFCSPDRIEVSCLQVLPICEIKPLKTQTLGYAQNVN